MVVATVSVVVPTRDRRVLIERTLWALAAQRGAPPFDVVVVDDASTDGTSEVLAALVERMPFKLTVVHQRAHSGPGAARNRGWQTAGGEHICFTDDDCQPTADWLARLTAALDAGADIAQGSTVPAPADRDRWGPFSHTVEVTAESGFYETCNIAYRRPWLEALGGFDPGYGYYCEDTDLAWRALEGGAQTRFVPQAVVHHAVGPSVFGDHLRSLRRRPGLVRLVRHHPGTRSILAGRWYQRPTHPPALVTGATLAAALLRPGSAVRWVAAGGSLLWYARRCVRTWKSPPRTRQWLTVVPMALAADLAEIAVLGRASVRERTLVL
jgi:GT2 family glycosyltransferase